MSEQQPRKRFVRRPRTPMSIQEEYEQNTLGMAAGFFCAIWAGRLLPDPLCKIFTSLSYPTQNGLYQWGIRDILLVWLLVSKVLFLRAALFRYVLRPLLTSPNNREFYVVQARVEKAGGLVISMASILHSMCILCFNGIESQEGPLTAASGVVKFFVLLQCAIQLSLLVVWYLENTQGSLLPMANHLLSTCLIAWISVRFCLSAMVAYLSIIAALGQIGSMYLRTSFLRYSITFGAIPLLLSTKLLSHLCLFSGQRSLTNDCSPVESWSLVLAMGTFAFIQSIN